MIQSKKISLSGMARVALAVVLSTAGTPALAEYPEKPVNYIIPFGPGGESDITARHQQPFFKQLFNQDMVISYKPGGGGAVGWSQLNDMTGDGYTIMGVNLPHIVIKPRQKDVGFKTDDLAIVYMFHYTPDALVVEKDSPFTSLEDVINAAKNKPGGVTFSGSGKASANHLAQIRFDQLAEINTTYVAFKGTGASVQALLGGNVSAQWGYTSVGAKHGDKVRLLAVAMENRHPRFPNVPTFRELGYDLVSGAYRGIAVPKSAPESVRTRLSEVIKAINADPEFQKKMENDGMALLDVGYEEMDAFIAEKTDDYVKAARAAKVIE